MTTATALKFDPVEEFRKVPTSFSIRSNRERVFSPQSVFDLEALEEFLGANGSTIPSGHRRRIWRAMIQDDVKRFEDVDSLGKSMATQLRQNFVLCTSTVVEEKRTASGCKMVIRLQSGAMVETVIIHHKFTNDVVGGGYGDIDKSKNAKVEGYDGNKTTPSDVHYSTVCVSSQVGCRMACTFCETGTMGLHQQLSASDIVEQVHHARRRFPTTLRNVVFMGMGEPLDNYNQVLRSVLWMNDDAGFRMAFSRITVSTVGVAVHRIVQMATEFPRGVHLAVSLHAPTDELRRRILPSSAAAPLPRLMDAVDLYLDRYNNSNNPRSHHLRDAKQESTDADDKVGKGKKLKNRRCIMMEYIMLDKVNSTEECAHALGQLLQGRQVQVNLIPYNPTDAGAVHGYVSPSDGTIQAFQEILTNVYGLRTHVRWSTRGGQSIDASCGQLALKNLKLSSSVLDSTKCTGSVSDIEELANTQNSSKTRRKMFRQPRSKSDSARGVLVRNESKGMSKILTNNSQSTASAAEVKEVDSMLWWVNSFSCKVVTLGILVMFVCNFTLLLWFAKSIKSIK